MKWMRFGVAPSFSRRAVLAGAIALFASSSASGTPLRDTSNADKSPKTVIIDLQTTAGNIQIEVYADRAPKVAKWFLKQVDAKALNGTKFFRAGHLQRQAPRPRFLEGGVLSPFILGENGQRPATAAEAGVPLLYDWETTQDSGLRHIRGSVSLARDVTGQGGALPDIVIALETIAELDSGGGFSPQNNGFPVFGQVVGGMDVVDAIVGQSRDGKTYVPLLDGQILSRPVQIQRVVRHHAGQVGAQ